MCVYLVHVCVRFILYFMVYMIGGAWGACVIYVCILYIHVYMVCNFTYLYIYLVVHLMFSGACVVHMYVCI